MKAIENKILVILSTDKNVLDDESAVQALGSSKMTANEIMEKQIVAETTEAQIDIARLAYTPIATHVTILYFTIGNRFFF